MKLKNKLSLKKAYKKPKAKIDKYKEKSLPIGPFSPYVIDELKRICIESQKRKNNMEENLTKAQAQLAFVKGKKIRHFLFLEDEFVCLNAEKKMIDENGTILDKMDFWLNRTGKKQFDNGWSTIE